ncbi:MAG: protein kinase [Burkholderiales bacterium]|nr:protein kinase [Burkholderiales bacterium]
MKKILVVEDEESIRLVLTLMLKAEGYTVDSAEDGRAGIEHAKSFAPDLIVSDVMMPELDGYGMLEALRADPRFADTPFIFLTALGDRTNIRRGMNLGADDFLNKPISRVELIEAVTSRLKKYENAARSLAERMVAGNDELKRWYRQSLSGAEAERPLAIAETAGMTGKMVVATVLFADIRNFTTYSERLAAGQIAELLNAYFEVVCQPIVRNGGRIAKLIGDGIMVVFEARPEDGEDNHARRAIRAGLGIVLAANKFGDWFKQRFGLGALPEFATGVGIHTGDLMEVHIGPPGAEDLTVVGDSVNVASRLEGQTKELGWPVVASAAAVGMAGSLVSVGESRLLELRGRNAPVEAMKVTGIGAYVGAQEGPIEVPASVRAALAENAQMTARAAKAALSETLRVITGELSRALVAGQPLQIKGYRVLSKIGEGGMSNVFLAERETDGRQVALKILNARPSDDKQLLQRFIQESALIYDIEHSNVVKIYDKGFTDDYAYIAMEYFAGGSLKDVIAHGLNPRQALSLLAQAAAALAEIHRLGIVHRDVKPANMMLRADGTMVLADFGIAKHSAGSMETSAHGEFFGTPYYISPEQVDGKPATERSDIYSLGIIFYEMLMNRRPFVGDSIDELIAQHLHAPVPRLSDALADYQGLLDAMLAKDPAERLQNADAVLAAIDRVWTQAALRANKALGPD